METNFFPLVLFTGLFIITVIVFLSPLFAKGENRKTLRELLFDKGNRLVLLLMAIGLFFIAIAVINLVKK
jgi:hypothetical protein